MSTLEQHFEPFRRNIVGIDQTFISPYGEKKIVYADWIASGRLYKPIEEKLLNQFGPLVGNTHSESSETGTVMTLAYHHAHKIIKKHCNAKPDDVIIAGGSGMTAMICKFQRMLGIKLPEQIIDYVSLPDELRPVVFITHMEHHSNHTSWNETIADVVIISPDKDGLPDLNDFETQIKKYKNRKFKFGALTACSNVTGIITPYHQLAKIIHEHGGFAFIDFACSAPYLKIDMHPPDPLGKLDAVFFSPHKFLGGPGTPGVMIFDSKLYRNRVPDQPGGGTVAWTNPWNEQRYFDDIEVREDGGTPPFLQTIKAAMAINLKEQMGINNLGGREEEIVAIAFNELTGVPGLHMLADNIIHRLGAISFYVDNVHYNLIVKILNDRFGIQVRGGCSCAGTYGHYLLHVDRDRSKFITDKIDHGDLSEKPGWVRVSLHPVMTNDEVHFICDSIKETIRNISAWEKDYKYSSANNEFVHTAYNGKQIDEIKKWFDMSLKTEEIKY